jgi:hypothetical protein
MHCPQCNSDRLEPDGKPSWLDGRQGWWCPDCGIHLGPYRSRTGLAVVMLAGLALAGVCLVWTLFGYAAGGWMPAGVVVGFVVAGTATKALASPMPVASRAP